MDLSCEPPPPPPEYEYHDIMSDYFLGESINEGTWTVHGEGVSLANSRLHIDSPEPWQCGVESRVRFFWPKFLDAVDIDGLVVFPDDTLSSVSLIHLQERWHPDGPDCYFMEFHRNREFTGDNEAFFGVQRGGQVVKYESLGSFNNGDSVHWEFFLEGECCTASFGGREQVSYVKIPDLVLNLHGSGGETQWSYVDVTLLEKL
jgi:hypothetical protein